MLDDRTDVGTRKWHKGTQQNVKTFKIFNTYN